MERGLSCLYKEASEDFIDRNKLSLAWQAGTLISQQGSLVSGAYYSLADTTVPG